MENLVKFFEKEFFSVIIPSDNFRGKGFRRELIFVQIRNQKNVQQ